MITIVEALIQNQRIIFLMIFRKFLVEKFRHDLLKVFSCKCSRRKELVNGSFDLFKLCSGEILLSG